MSAPFIIPFNFQPVQTVVSTASYTVPTGKYSKVLIEKAILPVLNSVSMARTAILTSNIVTGTTGVIFGTPYDCSRLTLNFNTSVIIYVHFSPTVAASSTIYTATNSSATNIVFNGEIKGGTPISVATSSAATITSVVSELKPPLGELWLKAGDVLTYSAGNIVYTEYNVIS
jgi:hypothetical protein